MGIIALVIFGPRKLPEMARKFGSMMSDFRRVSNDFRSTWSDAVSVEENLEGPKELGIDNDSPLPYEMENSIEHGDSNYETSTENDPEQDVEEVNSPARPEVKQMSEEEFNQIVEDKKAKLNPSKSEKTDWL